MNESQSAAPQCNRCGKPLPANAPEGICPRCLMAANLATDIGQPGGAEVKPPPQPPLPVNEVAALFPQLEILETLGRGGMGAVYKVRQPRLDRLAALKILSPEKQGDQQFAGRFEREARTLAQMNHPNIVTIYDFGETRNHCYLLMEFVDGLTLRQLFQTRMLSPAEALDIVPKICEALQYAHQRGVVHRDIKPENILLDKQGRVKIADFGIAKMAGLSAPAGSTEERQVIGTPHYMAPEQVEKPLTVDHRADIYSLGVVFYEMLTGELPLGKFAPPSSCARGIQVDVRLDDVVLRALEKEPERRYQQASEVKTAVETIVATKSNPIQPSAQNMNTNTNKSFWPVIIAACLVVTGLAAWFLLRTGHDPEKAARLSREGWALWQGRELDKAQEKFQESVRINPKDAAAWNGLGWASFNMGDSKEAEMAFQKVIAIEPSHPAALNGLGQLYLSQKKYDMAETYLLKAAPQAPAAWYGLARLYLGQEKFDEAAKWAGKVVESGQGDETAKQMLQAAKDKHLSDALRITLGLPATQ
jgi:tRNA A-37 threonylcarbamoyl transferase component Bud32/cytochrome c-type biogenesis protein CcmH/NrfG